MNATQLFTLVHSSLGFGATIGVVGAMVVECRKNDIGFGTSCYFVLFLLCTCGLLLSYVGFSCLQELGLIVLNVHHENWIFDVLKD